MSYNFNSEPEPVYFFSYYFGDERVRQKKGIKATSPRNFNFSFHLTAIGVRDKNCIRMVLKVFLSAVLIATVLQICESITEDFNESIIEDTIFELSFSEG